MAILLDSFPALGTAWWIEVFSPLPDDAQVTLATTLKTTITNFEARYSRFRPDSLVSLLNTTGVYHNPDEAFRAILHYGQTLHSRTAGAFNILVGATLEAIGYDAHYRLTPHEIPAVIPNPQEALVVAPEKISLHTGRVDLGGFGKGYLIDLLAATLQEQGVQEFLINGGGDMYASHEAEKPFTIHLEHPTSAATYIGTTALLQQGFAASSPFRRRWVHNGIEYNHIVGNTDVSYATFVKADSARDADAFATASLLWNDEEIDGITKLENIGIARHNPATSELTAHNFPFSAL